jgi:hypothetical protein
MKRKPKAAPPPKKKRELYRTSPCAKTCRHVWCDGYNAGYSDGEHDAIRGTN